MAVLHEEILKNACGTEEKAIQPTWLLTMASVDSISVKAVENEGGDDPSSPCMSLSPAAHASHSLTACASPPTTPCMDHSLMPHSPSHSPCNSPSLDHRSLGSRSSSSSSGSSSWSGSASGSTSGSGSSSSSGSGSGYESSTGFPEKSRAPAEDSDSIGLE